MDLGKRGLVRHGPGQYSIESAKPDSIHGDTWWNVDVSFWPGECDCPVFTLSRQDPPNCKHLDYLHEVEETFAYEG